MRQYKMDLSRFITSLSRLTSIDEGYLKEYQIEKSLNSLFFDKPPDNLTNIQIKKLEYLKELNKLYELETDKQTGFRFISSIKSGSFFADYFRNEENKNYICVALLNSQNELISVQNLFEGDLQAVIEHKKEFITRALDYNANSVIIGRFYSGQYENILDEEVRAMRQLQSIFKGTEIRINDYTVIRPNKPYFSYAESGYMDDVSPGQSWRSELVREDPDSHNLSMDHTFLEDDGRERLINSISHLTSISTDKISKYLQNNSVKDLFETKISWLTPKQEEKLLLLKEAKSSLPNILRYETYGEYILNSNETASYYLKNYFSNIVDKEYFVVVLLDRQNKIIKTEVTSRGTLTESVVYPREILKSTIYNKASSVILAHNHPGGSMKPSGADIEVTKKLLHVLNQVDVKIQDHIIIAGKHAVSIRSLSYDIFTDDQEISGSRNGKVLESSMDTQKGRFLVEWEGRNGKRKVKEFSFFNAASCFLDKVRSPAGDACIWCLSKGKPVWEKSGPDGTVIEVKETILGIPAVNSAYSKSL